MDANISENNAPSAPLENVNPPQPSATGSPSVAPIVDGAVEIERLKLDLQNKHEDFLRAKAETENIRRRGVEERIKAQKFAIESFALDLLPVVDALTASLSNPDAVAEKLLEGVHLTQKMLIAALEKNGVKLIPTEGEKFNPALHQAIATETCEGEPNRILKVLQSGYTLQERVLRPSMVTVSKAP